VKSKDVIAAITAAGWFEVRVKGSHHHFRHDRLKGLVTVPHPEKSLPKGTLRSIEKQSGVKLLNLTPEKAVCIDTHQMAERDQWQRLDTSV
jgi:predicted RNA binding protein YcfA (HicA-like mRNA interferase family)